MGWSSRPLASVAPRALVAPPVPSKVALLSPTRTVTPLTGLPDPGNTARVRMVAVVVKVTPPPTSVTANPGGPVAPDAATIQVSSWV